jgi:hypothetical protein
MKLQIQILRGGAAAVKSLERDGWKLEPEADDFFSASHPQVEDQPDARRRLDSIGLLISRALRVSFPPPAEKRVGQLSHN